MALAAPPVNGVLLKRVVTVLRSPAGMFRSQEFWYDKDTRTVDTYVEAETVDDTTYSRPVTDLVDRYCLTNETPFTERSHYHNGSGAAPATDVANPAACQITCTLTLTLTASAVVSGRGELTATASAAQGPVNFSLDAFVTAGVPGVPNNAGQLVYRFLNLNPGVYTVTARETRTAGCSATASAALAATYAGLFVVNFKNRVSSCQLLILERSYAGPLEDLGNVQPDPVVLDWGGGATDHVFDTLIKGSECQIGLRLRFAEQLLRLFSGDERLHKAEYRENGLLVWTGFLLPEQYDVAFLAPPNDFNLRATDGLGSLSDVPFAGPAGEALRGDWSLVRVLQFCLAKLDLNLPLRTLVNLYPAGATLAGPALEQTTVDVAAYADDKGKPFDCGKVLQAITTAYQARLYQQEGCWWVERLIELSPKPLLYMAYAVTGTRQPDVTRTLLTEIKTAASGLRPRWTDAAQVQRLRPAVSTVTATQEQDELVNMLRHVLPKNADLPGAVPSSWTHFTPVGRTAPLLGYVGKDKAPLLRLIGTATGVPGEATYVQTPLLDARVLRPTNGVAAGVTLTLTVTVFNATPNATLLPVAVRFGPGWLSASEFQSAGETDSTTPELGLILLNKNGKQELVFPWRASRVGGRFPLQVRLYAPTGGTVAATVDVESFFFSQGSSGGMDRDFTTEDTLTFTGDTGQNVSRRDEGTTLFHGSTADAQRTERRTGSILNADGQPVSGFYEASAPGQFRNLGDYLVRDRLAFQYNPAQVLTGTLAGPLPGPGALLTDPAEVRPGVYALTPTSYNAAQNRWQVTAVQLLTLTAGDITTPDNAIYYADAVTVWADAAGITLTYF